LHALATETTIARNVYDGRADVPQLNYAQGRADDCAQGRRGVMSEVRKTRTAARKAKAKPGLKRKAVPKDKAKTSRALKSDSAIYLTEDDVFRLVTVKDAIATLEDLFSTWSDPATVNLPRQRAPVGGSVFNLMGAAWGAKSLFGLKAYFAGGNGARYHVLLYSARDGKLKAMIESDHLGQMRTGAASGVATKVLAKPEARTLGIIGVGRQAFTQVAAVCTVRQITDIRVFSPTIAHRDSFARRIERELRIAAQPAVSAEAAVAEADVIIAITKSAEPVLRANWLKSGVHVNAAGANAATRREVDAETVLRATVRATDHLAQAKEEAAEYRDLIAAGRLKWQDITELGDIMTGKAPGRGGPADITLFKSLGIALEDIAFADLICRRAAERGVGKPT
jgi:ornithine cyclodeaminase/alanine dehydrogenase-like protein (mu-crystallin family)